MAGPTTSRPCRRRPTTRAAPGARDTTSTRKSPRPRATGRRTPPGGPDVVRPSRHRLRATRTRTTPTHRHRPRGATTVDAPAAPVGRVRERVMKDFHRLRHHTGTCHWALLCRRRYLSNLGFHFARMVCDPFCVSCPLKLE